jgi:hypothetical protein
MRYTWIHAINEPRNFSKEENKAKATANAFLVWGCGLKGYYRPTGLLNLISIIQSCSDAASHGD